MGKAKKKARGAPPPAASAVTVREELDGTKPESDPKSYRFVRLANGLECVLIHDPAAAAAADDDDSEGEDDGDDGDDDDDDDDDGDGDDDGGGGVGGRAAAAMAVAAGSWDDPEALPGLAHFCEHMLFMGSARFPEENAYDAFLQRNGGSDNACVESRQRSPPFPPVTTTPSVRPCLARGLPPRTSGA